METFNKCLAILEAHGIQVIEHNSETVKVLSLFTDAKTGFLIEEIEMIDLNITSIKNYLGY